MSLPRRHFLTASAALAAAAAVPSAWAATSEPQPSRYPDKAWKVIDKRFEAYYLFNAPLERQWSGGLWLEGPAWNAVGRYAVFSDIPRARQMRWDEVTGQVSVLREGVGHSNGNTFDHQGRLVACEHSPPRVVRYEWDGSVSVLASTYNGKPLNAPNDLVALPEGGVIFTDPAPCSRAIASFSFPTRVSRVASSIRCVMVALIIVTTSVHGLSGYGQQART